MSLKEDTSKDTYINLILSKSGERVVALGECPFVSVDITEPVIQALDGFGPDCVVGLEYQIEGVAGNAPTLYYEKELRETIIWEVERLLDASIVNEKQKNALKELLHSRIYSAFEKKRQTMNVALNMLYN